MKSKKIKREKERKKKKNERKTDNALLLYNAEMRQKYQSTHLDLK